MYVEVNCNYFNTGYPAPKPMIEFLLLHIWFSIYHMPKNYIGYTCQLARSMTDVMTHALVQMVICCSSLMRAAVLAVGKVEANHCIPPLLGVAVICYMW